MAEPSRNIDSYVVFAYDRATFHGKDNPAGVQIHSGNVGVNNALAGDFALTFLGSGVHAADGTEMTADSAKLVDASTVWDLYANSTNLPFGATVHSGPTNYAGPIIDPADLPAAPVCSPGVDDVDIPIDGALTLDPGAYGLVHIRKNATLTLKSGVYNFAEIDGELQSKIVAEDDTIVNVDERMKFGQNSVISGSGLARFNVCATGVTPFDVNQDGIAARSVFIDDGSTFYGQVFNPNHWTTFGNHTQLFGRFWARGIHSDTAPEFTKRAPESISGSKFLDANGNGQQDGGESGLEGLTFYIDVDGDGQYDADTDPSAVSAADGTWSIGPLNLTGSYKVREVGKAGYTCTFPQGDCSYTVDLGASGDDHPGNIFGNAPPPCVQNPNGPGCKPEDCTTNPGEAGCTPPPCNPATDANKCGTPTGSQGAKAGKASLSAPSGCLSRTVTVRIRGTSIATVRFYLDGKRVGTVKSSPYRVKLNTAQLKAGAHKLTAKVTFVSASRTAPQTRRLTLHRCGRRSLSPTFTG